MPLTFTALQNDLDFYEKSLVPQVSKEEIIEKVKKIWLNYCDRDYIMKFNAHLGFIALEQERRLRNLFAGSEEDFKIKKSLLLSAYKFMENFNNHLSVPPKLFEKTKIVELFGSPLNTSQEYCSPFALEKECFSSKGSFFDYEINPGLNIANPPFDETIMENMADRLEDQLNQTPGINVICIIPVWDPESQAKYGLKQGGKPFAAYTKLKNSRFFKEGFYLDKKMYRFWNYYSQRYIPVSAIHFILLGNTETLLFDPLKLLEQWRNLTPNER